MGRRTSASRRHLKRAVIASEDAGFAEHSGVEWDALEKAWERNQKAEARAEKINEQLAQRRRSRDASAGQRRSRARAKSSAARPSPSSSRRTCSSAASATCCARRRSSSSPDARGAAGKQRILEIYLNNVEWGEGVFGAEAAARHYFRVGAARLGARRRRSWRCMLPAPKRFEKRPGSAYVVGRAATIVRAHGRGRAAVTRAALTGVAALPRIDRWPATHSEEIAAGGRPPGRRGRHGIRRRPSAARRATWAPRPRDAELPEQRRDRGRGARLPALFCADTQPRELAALRGIAARLDGTAGGISGRT